MVGDVSWVGAALGAIGAIDGGALTWLAARHMGKSDLISSQAAMVKAAQDAATSVIATLREELESLGDRLETVESELRQEREARREERQALASKAMAAEKRALDAEKRANELEARCLSAEGRARDLQQQLDGLTRKLRAEGVDVPAPPERTEEPILLGDAVI